MMEFEQKTNDFISEYFSKYGKSTRNDVEVWIQEQLEDALTGLPTYIYENLNGNIKEKAIEVESKESKRFFAEVDAHNAFWIKSPSSILDKMIRSYGKNPENSLSCIYTPDNFISEMEDIVRFRILCNYLDDINEVKKILSTCWWDKTFPIERIKDKDHYSKPPEKRESGHRAHHYIYSYNGEKVKFHFEVQVMTILGHGWDKKDHPLFYEYTRIRDEENLSEPELLDKIQMFAMSEMLYVADVFFDSLRKRILENRRG
ncbi:MAG: hypothetical protein AB9903_14825 [Vulcanimicrobiota bacterium]